MSTTETEPTPMTLDELHARLRAIAPEIRNEEPTALAELVDIEQAIETEKKRQRIADLADAEEAERERLKAEAALEAQREQWRAEKATTEKARDAAFSRFEKLITQALDAAREGIEASASATSLAGDLGVPRGPDFRMLVENRILRRVHEELGMFGVKPGIVLANEGRAPLAIEAPSCAVCEHEHRADIESERGDGASLRVLAERHNVGRTTLSEHFRDHAEG